MVTRQWVAIHRKHHQCTDEEGDPHSPLVYGIRRVLFKGALLYHAASKDKEMIAKYTPDIEDDWIERKLYTPHSRLGILLMLVINLVLFGPWGFVIWGVQMIWIPFWAAGVINGVGHWFGYRNHETKDNSRNIFPWGIIVGGEELHNNHHRRPADARLSHRAGELDIGWLWLTVFRIVGLAKLR
jgi:stearoyl-CoA desaturase (delta-9 desaturase)